MPFTIREFDEYKSLQNLTEEGKEELALMIILWKDFKTQGKLDIKITEQAINFAHMFNVKKQYDKLLILIPPMKIEPRYCL